MAETVASKLVQTGVAAVLKTMGGLDLFDGVKILPVQYSFSDYYKTGGDELHADTLFPGGVLLVSLDPMDTTGTYIVFYDPATKLVKAVALGAGNLAVGVGTLAVGIGTLAATKGSPDTVALSGTVDTGNGSVAGVSAAVTQGGNPSLTGAPALTGSPTVSGAVSIAQVAAHTDMHTILVNGFAIGF